MTKHPWTLVTLLHSLTFLLITGVLAEAHPPKSQVTIQAGPVTALALSPDGKILAGVTRDKGVRLWDPASGKELFPLPAGRLVHGLSFSPDSCFLATGNDEGNLQIWDRKTGKLAHQIERPGRPITSVSISADQKTLAATGVTDTKIELWEFPGGKFLRALEKEHQQGIDFADFSPDGKTLASISYDHRLCLWNPYTGQCLRTCGTLNPNVPSRIRGMGPVVFVTFSHDGKLLASWGSYGPISLWDVETGKEHRVLRLQPTRGNSVAFSPDGQYLVIAGHSTLWIFDPASGREIRKVEGFPRGWVGPVAFAPKGQLLFAATIEGSIQGWNVKDLLAP